MKYFGAVACFVALGFSLPVGPVSAQVIGVNGDFETQNALGWTEWSAPWGAAPFYDYASAVEPFEGEASFYQSASSGSFGVYQELCVEPGVTVVVDWAWKGASNGNGWWEVLLVDGPYSYGAADDPAGHPETFVASKWESGFGGAFPAPSADWVTESAELTPSTDVVTVVLKCGSTEGGLVEVQFDSVVIQHDGEVLEVDSIEPAMGKLEGGDPVLVKGRIFGEGTKVSLGDVDLEPQARESSCSISGLTPPGAAGVVDVVVTTSTSYVKLEGGFRYVPPPVVTSVSPTEGPAEGGTSVMLVGEAFVATDPASVVVLVGGKALENLAVVDETTITGETPPGEAGSVDIVVKTPFGEVTAPAAFLYDQTAPLFVRGDCNADGEMNITDAISLLGFLFLGDDVPSCLESCNTNDDAEVNITDAISSLGYLFTGGVAPLAPYPECGADPTPSAELSCESGHDGC